MTKFSHESGSDRIFEALEKHDQDNKYEKIINLQGDLPNIDPSFINLTCSLLEKNLDADISTLCSPISNNKEFENPNVVKAYVNNSLKPAYADDFVRMPGSYHYDKLYHHLGIYGYKRSSLKKFISTDQSAREKDFKLEQLRALDNSIKINVALAVSSPIGVDTEEDFVAIKKIMEYKS